jgi:hypothetical protein
MTRTGTFRKALGLAAPTLLASVLACGVAAGQPNHPTPTPMTVKPASVASQSHRAHIGRPLPICRTEDGAGQALCWWSASRQGNGKGRSVVSGDCAPAVVGASAVKACVKLHSQPAYSYRYQGATVRVPAGPALIDECVADSRTEGGKAYLRGCFEASLR